MRTSVPDYAREKLGEWQRDQVLLGAFLAVGGGTYCSMRVRLRSLARHIVTLQGETSNLALWINDARFEYGPVDMFLSPTPPPRQVTGVSIYLKIRTVGFHLRTQRTGKNVVRTGKRTNAAPNRGRQ